MIPTYSATVEPYLHGVRIDSFLAKHLRSYTTWRLHRMVRAGMATVDGEPAPPVTRVRRGQTIAIRLNEPPDDPFPPEPRAVDVLFEDEWLVAVNKPPGLIIHPCGEAPTGTLANVIQHHLDTSGPARGMLKPGLVHRLDRDTTGVVVVAKEHNAHRLLSVQFQKERTQKTYLVIVEGNVENDSGLIDLPIGRAPGTALMSCRADAQEARASRTAYEVVERLNGYTLVRAKPRTGRLHQIRIHFATIGHPLLGDEYYLAQGRLRPPRPKDVRREDLPPVSDLIPRHALHAAELSFQHPISEDWMTIAAPLPVDFSTALERLRSPASDERDL